MRFALQNMQLHKIPSPTYSLPDSFAEKHFNSLFCTFISSPLSDDIKQAGLGRALNLSKDGTK